MLLAKINPPAKINTQESPFAPATETTGEYMRVSADRYLMGSTSARFQAAFGFLVPNGIDRFSYQPIHSQTVILDSSDLQDWGTDDTVIFTKIATKIGISVVETVDINITDDF